MSGMSVAPEEEQHGIDECPRKNGNQVSGPSCTREPQHLENMVRRKEPAKLGADVHSLEHTT